jgi:signal transduction histidine kinase
MPHSNNTTDMSESALSSTNSTDPQIDGKRALETLRASQKLIHLGRMAASIAHEINNPLESITNLLYLLRSEPGISQSALAYLDMAEREMERVVTITRQTLNFARETAEPVALSVPGLLEEVLVLNRRRIDEKQIRVIQRYAPTEHLRIFPGEIRQVLANLIVNAIEASSLRGSLTLRVRPSFAARHIPGIRISIADNGTGIPPEVRRHLGEPFFTTKGQGGTGLGLWVSRSIVERYGGQLRFRSTHVSERLGKLRHGTVFSLFLPLRNGQNRGGNPSGSGSSLGSGPGPVLVQRPANSPREAHAGSPHSSTAAD